MAALTPREAEERMAALMREDGDWHQIYPREYAGRTYLVLGTIHLTEKSQGIDAVDVTGHAIARALWPQYALVHLYSGEGGGRLGCSPSVRVLMADGSVATLPEVVLPVRVVPGDARAVQDDLDAEVA